MAAGFSYLVVQLPRHVIIRCAAMLENGPEVDFDKLPLRSMTEVTKDSAQTSQKKNVVKKTFGIRGGL